MGPVPRRPLDDEELPPSKVQKLTPGSNATVSPLKRSAPKNGVENVPRSRKKQVAKGTKPIAAGKVQKTTSNDRSATQASRRGTKSPEDHHRRKPGKVPADKHNGGEPAQGSSSQKGLATSLPPLSRIEEIFSDLVKNACKKGFGKAVEGLSGKIFRIATACSGTEAPILALQEIQRALAKLLHNEITRNPLRFIHIFSAEIEPFKQAYIHRNFNPMNIFRDIRELAYCNIASTVYGSGREVPRELDILVAGFSCVDFSRLNKNRKELGEGGESSQTFDAIFRYLQRSHVKVVILENVLGAPWTDIKSILSSGYCTCRDKYDWGDGHPGYSCELFKANSKDYYIPHSRQRGYMICIRNSIPGAAKRAEEWKAIFEGLARPASVPFEAFLLKNDDMRVKHAHQEMASNSDQSTKEGSWVLSRDRHEVFRKKHHLGDERPVTDWADGGTCKPVDYWWNKWTRCQVERIWDSLEINVLRACRREQMDWLHKARIVDISQNIDRNLDTAPPGIVGCLTSTGIHWFTSRGGPIIGLESLALQGLPIDKLVLTRESQKELVDLAGNAMTTTVVGSALIALFMVVGDQIGEVDDTPDKVEEIQCLEFNDKALRTYQPTQIPSVDHFYGAYDLRTLAYETVALCYCEGQADIAPHIILVCKKCGHTACKKCGINPQHLYEPCNRSRRPRVDPLDFEVRVKQALPMRLRFDIIDLKRLKDENAGKHNDIWQSIVKDLGDPSIHDLRFRSVRRSRSWTVSYTSARFRLDLLFDESKTTWFLFLLPDPSTPGNCPKRAILKAPIARMESRFDDFLKGYWQFRVPKPYVFRLRTTGLGTQQPSWEANLGLIEPDQADKKDSDPKVVSSICGDYEYLPDCGTARHGLHKRDSDGKTTDDTFLLCDSNPYGKGPDDCFVFSHNTKRPIYEESRSVIARLESSWRPTSISNSVECTIDAHWVGIKADLELSSTQSPPPAMLDPAKLDIVSTIDYFDPNQANRSDCATSTYSILSCRVQVAPEDFKEWVGVTWATVDPTQYTAVLSDLAFVLNPICHLDNFPNKYWTLNLAHAISPCTICAPAPPKLKWASHKSGKAWRITPYEHEVQALGYEEHMKRRPEGLLLQINKDDTSMVSLRLGVNIVTIAHQALANLPRFAALEGPTSSGGFRLQWRLDTKYRHYRTPNLKPFALKSNEHDKGDAIHTFSAERQPEDREEYAGKNLQLRPEQQRALRWMIRQESSDRTEFWEQEIVEAMIPQLGIRLEVRAQQLVDLCKGGIVADDVGFGKTITIVALVDSQMRAAETAALETCPGLLSLKATLIVVPHTLIDQWGQQIEKFLGCKYVVIKIKRIEELKNLTVEKLKEAHFVIIAWTLFEHIDYIKRIAYLAALPPGPESTGARALRAWLQRASIDISRHIDAMKNVVNTTTAGSSDREEQFATFAKELNKELKTSHEDKANRRMIPLRRTKGAQFNIENTYFEDRLRNGTAECEVSKADKPTPKETLEASVSLESNPFNIAKCSGELDQLQGLPFHAFRWNRIVLDEYTYVDEKLHTSITAIPSLYRWALSGTPRFRNFNDVKEMASLIGVHLGIDDDTRTSMSQKDITRFRNERTAAETFRAFNESRSPTWYEQRQELGQTFLDCFVRKNVAEIGEIPFQDHLLPVHLGSLERPIYADIHEHVLGANMQLVRNRQSILDKQGLDLSKKLQKISSDAEEALIRCASFVDAQEEYQSNLTLPSCLNAIHKFILKNRLRKLHEGNQEAWKGFLRLTFKDETLISEEKILMGEKKRVELMKLDDMWREWLERHSVDTSQYLIREPTTKSCWNSLISTKYEQYYDCEEKINMELKKGMWLLKSYETLMDNAKKSNMELAKDLSMETAEDSSVETDEDLNFSVLHARIQDGLFEDDDVKDRILYLWDDAAEKQKLDEDDCYVLSEEWELGGDRNFRGRHFKRWRPSYVTAETHAKIMKAEMESKRAKIEAKNQKVHEKKMARLSKQEEKKDQADDKQQLSDEEVNEEKEYNKPVKAKVPTDIKVVIDEEIIPTTADEFKLQLTLVGKSLLQLFGDYMTSFRAIRYLRAFQHLQAAQVNTHKTTKCGGCRSTISNLEDAAVLGKCGHIVCRTCLDNRTEKQQFKCVCKGCRASARIYQVHYAPTLGTYEDTPFVFGSKTETIIDLINSIDDDEQVLVFVQWFDLGEGLAKALEKAKIPFYSMATTSKPQQAAALQGFSNCKAEDKDARKKGNTKWGKVLILCSGEVSATGANLTGANHVIFVAPLHTEEAVDFTQSERQCIGRARRFGQNKLVHIYKFVALNTQDVDEYQMRYQARLLKGADGEWFFKPKSELTDEDAKQQHGNGYVKRGMEPEEM